MRCAGQLNSSPRIVHVLATCLVLLIFGTGCETARFYTQAIKGELEILRQRRSLADCLDDPSVPQSLKKRFELVIRLRKFAEKELNLPVNKHYLSYVDLHRPFAVWNVHAAPEFSLTPKSWWYPIVGKLKYRGYFTEEYARNYAGRLRSEGYDVHVEGVEAYSTLGWFKDPLLNTFIHHRDVDLAEIIFHELAHQRLFFSGDTDFNEAFATTVAEEGVRRWLSADKDLAAVDRYQKELGLNREFVHLVMETRRQLAQVYDSKATAVRPHSRGEPSSFFPSKREEKAHVVDQLRTQYLALKLSWDGYSGYDNWFKGPLNNAQLNTVAVYYELVPGLEMMLQNCHGDLDLFFKQAERLKKLSKKERHRNLETSGSPQERPADESLSPLH